MNPIFPSRETNAKIARMKVAATLCWVLGLLNLLGAVAIGIPMLANKQSVAYPLLMLVVGVGLCISGYSLRKKHNYAGILAVVFAFLSIFSPPVLGLIMGAAIILLIALSWHESS